MVVTPKSFDGRLASEVTAVKTEVEIPAQGNTSNACGLSQTIYNDASMFGLGDLWNRCFPGCPVSRGTHIDPVTMQFEPNLGIGLWHDKLFQWRWDGKIQSTV